MKRKTYTIVSDDGDSSKAYAWNSSVNTEIPKLLKAKGGRWTKISITNLVKPDPWNIDSGKIVWQNDESGKIVTFYVSLLS